ncbi:MAG: rhodanese-like domain-containing protein [Deltaproteobacteria bacterium]|nr:rhodanese-like domain-containing protein [Deltaproteobacteria bacterium]
MTVHRVSPREAAERMSQEAFAYVDVRTPGEFESGHPAGAYNIPVALASAGGMTPNTAFVAVFEANFAKDAKVILGCQSGNRSMRAAAALEAAGFTGFIEQRAGWGGVKDPFGKVLEKGWQAEGLEVGSGPGDARSYEALSRNVK